MNAHALSLYLRQYGIATAMHNTACASMQYKNYQGGDLPACTCGLAEIRAEVEHQLRDDA